MVTYSELEFIAEYLFPETLAKTLLDFGRDDFYKCLRSIQSITSLNYTPHPGLFSFLLPLLGFLLGGLMLKERDYDGISRFFWISRNPSYFRTSELVVRDP